MKREAWQRVKSAKRRRISLGVLTLLLVLAVVAAGCGASATATPVPDEAAPAPQPTATTPPPEPEPEEPETTLRPISEWTAENPATLEEIEAQLELHRGESFTLISEGGRIPGGTQAGMAGPA